MRGADNGSFCCHSGCWIFRAPYAVFSFYQTQIFEAYLLYWNAGINNIYRLSSNINTADLVLRVRNKGKKPISLLVSDITINEISINELDSRHQSDESDKLYVSNYLDVDEVCTKCLELSWYNSFKEIKEISEISFSIVARSEDNDIANVGPFTICRDPRTEVFYLK